MKKLILSTLFLFATISFISCGPDHDSELGLALAGQHYLSILPNKTDTLTATPYFKLRDNGKSVMFMWQLPDSTFTYSTLELSKIRLRIDPNSTTPSIAFRWRPGKIHYGWDVIMENYVSYALLTVKADDFPFLTPEQ